jgi:aerobic carbon-monoxide dehydrogenase small subunit
MKHRIETRINGISYRLEVEPHWTLLELLRNVLRLTGAKDGCGMGECGSCTVIMDGKTIYSCLTLAVRADGKEVLTIEGLARGEELDPMQKVFIEHGAFQCGFCTPGMILSGKALLDENPSPNEEEIKRGISGNLCRCTGYNMIVEAIRGASERRVKKG